MTAGTSLTSQSIRRVIVDQAFRAHEGHIGSALSIADVLVALYGNVLSRVGVTDADRDLIILSKGHAALALYAALNLIGRLDDATLDTYGEDGSRLGVHPQHHAPGVALTTGSLGHGLSVAVGAAMAARMQGSRRRVYVILSDAECNEGSVWEAIMFAAQREVGNLTAIVDANGQQALGSTASIVDMANMQERWATFGWDAHNVDGHDVDALTSAMHGFKAEPNHPHVVVARTVFAKGIPFMERQLRWHYASMTGDDHAHAIRELEEASSALHSLER